MLPVELFPTITGSITRPPSQYTDMGISQLDATVIDMITIYTWPVGMRMQWYMRLDTKDMADAFGVSDVSVVWVLCRWPAGHAEHNPVRKGDELVIDGTGYEVVSSRPYPNNCLELLVQMPTAS